MERRFLLAILLSVGAVLAWQYWFAPPPPPKGKPAAPAATGPDGPVPAAGPGAPAPAPGPGPSPAPSPPAAAGPEPVQRADHQEFLLTPTRGEMLRAGFTTRGAALTQITLRHAHEKAARDVPAGKERWPLDLIVPAYPDLLTGMVAFDAEDAEGLRTLDWTVEDRQEATVTFSFRTRSGFLVRKRFTLPLEPDRYDLEISLSVTKVEGAPAAGEQARLRLLGTAGFIAEPSNHTGMETPVQPFAWVQGRTGDPVVEEWRVDRMDLDTVQIETRAFRLAGVKSHFFTSTLYTPGGEASPRVTATWVEGGDARGRDVNAATRRLVEFFQTQRGRPVAQDPGLGARLQDAALNFHRAWTAFDLPIAAAGTQAPVASFRLYTGPLSRRVLGQEAYAAIDPLITYPFAPDFVAKFLLSIFDLGFWVTGSAGLAVILMTLIVRGGLMPISIRNQLSMRRHGRKVARLKPKLDVLKTKFGKDPKRFREEQMKLFKEHGVGFPMGCLLLLFQIPIFFSLFASLRIEYGIRHQAFLWIHDLSGPDRFVDFGLAAPLVPFPPGGIWAFNLLPILYMGLSIWQQRLMPKPMDEQQAQQMKMAKWMTIIFPVLLYNYTAALALYMVFSAMVAIIESRIVRHKDQQEDVAAPAA